MKPSLFCQPSQARKPETDTKQCHSILRGPPPSLLLLHIIPLGRLSGSMFLLLSSLLTSLWFSLSRAMRGHAVSVGSENGCVEEIAIELMELTILIEL